MSDDGGGTDNPAFSNDEETSYDNSASTASVGHQEAVTPTPEHEHPPGDSKPVTENGKSNGSIAEAARANAEQQRPGETRIEVPEEAVNDKKAETPKAKQNGVHGNGNNNDVSFLNTTVTSVTNNDVTDKKEQIEAVNLELVSMKPYAGANNGQTKNQEACEVPTDPYEEYFVPVNEHRKYIRGEKLYVTKDKRSTGSYWRRVVCWGCGFLLIAIAAIIAILAGTGVILTQEATQPLLNADKTSYRQFNDIQTAGSQEYVKNPPSSPPPVTSTFPPWQTTDETLYKLVPKALDGVIKLDNLDWNDDMYNPKSRVYRDVAEHIESSLVNMLRLNDNKPVIKVYSISKDGEVKFRVGQSAFEKPEDNQDYLENKFRQNGNTIGKYHLNHLKMNVLVDECSSGMMGCSHYCTYDYLKGLFECSCPSDKMLDSNGKQCNDITHLDSGHQHEGTLQDDVQGRSRVPDDVFHVDDHHWNTHFDLHPKHDENPSEYTSEPTLILEPKSEPTAEPEPPTKSELQVEHEPSAQSEPNLEPESSAEPEPKSEPEPSAESEPKFQPEPSAEPEPKSEPEPSSEPEPKAEPEPSVELNPNSEPQPSAEPESKSEPEPSAEPEPSTEPRSSAEPSADPEPKSEPEPSAEPETKSEPEASAEPEPISEPESSAEPEPKSQPEPSAEPEPKSEPEASAEPEPKAEPEASIEPESKSEPEPSVESEPRSEPESSVKSEPKSEPEASAEPEPKSEPEPSVKPELKSEPESSVAPESTSATESSIESEPKSEPEPSVESEPKSEPEPSVESVPKSEPEPSVESEPKSEPEPSVESEPKSEPEPSVESEPKSEPEPSAEPEPSVDPEHKSEPEPSAEPKAEPEPSAEPKAEPEPSAEPKAEPETSVKPDFKLESKSSVEPEPNSEPERSVAPESKSESQASIETDPSVKPEPFTDSNLSTAFEPVTEAGPVAESKPSAESELSAKAEPPSEIKNETNSHIESEGKLPTESVVIEPATEPKNEQPKLVFNGDVEEVLKTENVHESETESVSRSDLDPATEPKSEAHPVVESKSEQESILPESIADATIEPEMTTEIVSEEMHPNVIHTQSNSDISLEHKNESEQVVESKNVSKSVIELNVGLESSTESKLFSESSTEININAEKKEFAMITETTMTTKTPDANEVTTEKNLSDVESITEQNDELENDKIKPTTDKKSESSTELIFSTEMPKGLISDISVQPEMKSENEFSTTQMSEPATVIGLNNGDSYIDSSNRSSVESSQNKIENNTLSSGTTKKAPRLDKDEQDTPNPFELSVKDVITSETTTRLSVTSEMSLSVNSEKHLDTALNNDSEINKTHEVVEVNKKQEEISEDQYNDILDEFDPKGFGKNDLGSAHDITKNEKKILKISKEVKDSKSTDYTDSTSSYTSSEKSPETVIQSSTDSSLEKHSEDPNITSQVPILPVEIQMDMLTTENVDKMETQATSQEPEKEVILTINPSNVSHSDGKTTEQIPILPDELLTTDASKEQHAESSTTMYQINKRVDESSTNVDEDIYKNESTLKSNEMVKMNQSNPSIIETSNIDNNTFSKINETSMEEDVKPVFESISDDTVPQTFEYKFFLTTTTENSESQNIFDELSEEQLKVIPLESKSDSSTTLKSDDQQPKFKKEKELSLEISNENIELTPKNFSKSSRTVEDENIPKLISGTITTDSNINTTFNSLHNDTDFNAKSVKYPNFIPVSEEIDENDNRFTEPSITIPFKNEQIMTDLPELNLNKEKNIESETKITTLQPDTVLEISTLNSVNIVNQNDNTTAIKLENKENETSTTSSTSKPSNPEDQVIPVAIINSEDPLLPIFFSKCKSGQFQCINGTSRDGAYCVNLSAKCDSENDCSDGSDEVNCEKEGCPGNFQCASGQCLKRHLVCNGIVDCDDGSDEKECEKWKCNFDEFQCPNGRCIPVLWQCDGRPDCENHADEYSCSESCDNDEYLCPVEKWCIPQTWRCNGVSECLNEEDEKLCECAIEQFKCETGGCIPAEQLCDGVENCPDKSDEWDCLSNLSKNASVSIDFDKENKDNEFSTRSSPLKIRQSNGDYRFVCSDGWSEEFSDQYCRALGFAGSESTQYTEQGKNSNLLQLISNASPNASLVINLEKINSCKSEKVVEISCQEFTCGSHESVGPTARLVGGTPASEGQWSSVALLKEPKYGSACTASVLSPMHALASYSCIHSYRQSNGWQLFVGGNLLKPHKVKNIVPYPQVKYNQFLYNNDIALVELDEPLIFSRNVSAVCLPNQSFQPRQLCVTAGWGFPVNGEVDLQQYLKFLPVPTYDSEECNATSHYAGFITKHNICAGFTDTDKGPCYNDEGAPLMCVSETGRWEIQGLLSHHSRCSRGHPAIYSSIAPALSWLRNSVPALQS